MKKELEALIKAGAMDSIHSSRSALLQSLEEEISRAKKWKESSGKGAWTIFGDSKDSSQVLEYTEYPIVNDNKSQILEWENEVLCHYFSGHPLEDDIQKIRLCISHTSRDIESLSDRDHVTIGGIIRQPSTLQIKGGPNKGKKMAKFLIEEIYGRIQCVIFSASYEEYNQFVVENAKVIVHGSVLSKNDITEVSALRIETIEDCLRKIKSVHLSIKDNQVESTARIIQSHQGTCRVYLRIETPNLYETHQTNSFVSLDTSFLHTVEQQFGEWSLQRYD